MLRVRGVCGLIKSSGLYLELRGLTFYRAVRGLFLEFEGPTFQGSSGALLGVRGLPGRDQAGSDPRERDEE